MSTPTTPTTASIIGALQVQELVKMLHGMDALLGRGVVFDGSLHNSFTVSYPKNPDCPWHDAIAAIETCADLSSDVPLSRIWGRAAQMIDEPDALDLSREIVAALRCARCNVSSDVFQPVEKIAAEQIPCPTCSAERTPELLHSIGRGSVLLDRTPREIGLPAWDIVWARNKQKMIGLELSGDHHMTE